MSYDDGWIVETGTSLAHYRQANKRMCNPKKKLRGVHLVKALVPAPRCEECVTLLDKEFSDKPLG